MPGPKRKIISGKISDSKRSAKFNFGEMSQSTVKKAIDGARKFTKNNPGTRIDIVERDAPTTVGYNPKFSKGYDNIKGFGKKKKGKGRN